jgi:hypothetical protein
MVKEMRLLIKGKLQTEMQAALLLLVGGNLFILYKIFGIYLK